MPSVSLPENCLNDPGRGRAWLLTTVAHWGGQDAIDYTELAISTALRKGVSWKKIIAKALATLPMVFTDKQPVGTVADEIDAIPAPANMPTGEE